MVVNSSGGPSATNAEALQLLNESFPDDIIEIALPQGDATAIVRPRALRKILEFLKDDPRLLFDLLADLTAVDYVGRKPRFDVVYHLVSLPFKRRLRIKIRLEESAAEVDSVTSLWGCADWLHQAGWGMRGICSAGH